MDQGRPKERAGVFVVLFFNFTRSIQFWKSVFEPSPFWVMMGCVSTLYFRLASSPGIFRRA